MITLDGSPCIDPGILKLAFQDAGFSIWWEKYSANYFRHQCGIDPGKGYLLLLNQDIPLDSFSVPLVIGNATIPKVVVIRSVELEALSESPTGLNTSLVEIADIRHYLNRTVVKKNYNVVRYFDSSGNEVFEQTTTKFLGGSSYTPYTWQTLIEELWEDSLLTAETLNLADVTFPTAYPNNYYFETWSHRDALAQVFLDLGLTLEPNTDGSWRAIPVSVDTNFLNTVAANVSKLIQSNNLQDGEGEQLPAKFIFNFYYPEESPAGKENRTYKYEYTVSPQHSYQDLLSGSHQVINCPLQAAFDFTDPTQPLNKVDLDAFAATLGVKLTKLLFTDDGHDKTFGGFLNIFPSADVGRVTWKDTGSNIASDGTGPITRLEHCFPVARPPKQTRPTVPLQKVAGNPSANVTPLMTTFQLINLELINGVKPVEPLTVNNTYGRTISNSARVVAEYSYQTKEWDTPEVGGTSSSSGNSLIRFEVIEDKDTSSLTANAFAINPNNFAPLYPITLLDAPSMRYGGFAERDDPQFGYQHGARGWCQEAYSTVDEETEEVTTYCHIITMEGPARWITGKTLSDVSNSESTGDNFSFTVSVEKYWGAYPNHRAPAMTEEESQGSFYIRIYDQLGLVKGTIPEGTKYRAIYDEKQNLYVLIYIETSSDIQVGMLVKDIPAAVIDITTRKCVPGKTKDAVVLLQLSDTEGYIPLEETVAGINTSQTAMDIDDSGSGRLIVVHGKVISNAPLGNDEFGNAMVIIPFDAASTPNFVPGDPQVFYKDTNSRAMRMDAEECPPPP